MALSSQLFAIAFCALLSQTCGVEFRWCTKGSAELAKCNLFKAALPNIAKMVGADITPACVDGMTATNCYEKIKRGEADLITLDVGEIYMAGKDYGMIPIVYEDYGGQTGNSYYAVAVAKSNSSINLGNLRGKKSCHTGYQKTAGYNVPVGYLLESKKMDRVACGVLGTAKSVSQFFSKSCIPGVPSQFPNLCELCPNKNCVKSRVNPYYDYSGAFKCLADGAGDVAFVKHLTVPEMVKMGGYGNLSDYVYLCKDGTRKVVTKDSYKDCHLSNNPSHAVMTMSGRSIDDFKKVLLKASEVCQGHLSMANCSGFKIFESTGGRDLLFKDSTKQLVDVGNKDTYQEWLGTPYMDTLKGLESPCPSSPASVNGVEFRWCVKGNAELTKCNLFKDALPNIAKMVGVDITPACVNGENAKNCYAKIKNGEADLITLDGGEIYDAGKNYGMVPIVYEDYGGQTGNSYYPVAVAKRNSSINLGNLRGKKSCHTGYQKTAGYNVPVGYLLESKKMERAGCGDLGTAKSVSQFFSKSCIPGAPSQFTNLCELCLNNNCKKSTDNPYYGYSGAFKCLADGAGDVAFVKHLTVPDMVKKGGYGNLSDYIYLCKDNSFKVVTNDSYVNCHLSNNPSHAVMTMSGRNIDDFKKVLLKASEVCQGNLSTTNCSSFEIFKSTGGKDLLFKDSTKQLIDVGNKNTYQAWLGTYMDTLKGLESPCPPSSRASVIGPVPTTLFLYLFAGSLLMLFT